jgi:predicted dehydrogenase
MDGRFEVVAGCFSRDADANAETGQVFNAAMSNSAAELLGTAPCDAVVVLTPTPTHLQDVKYFLRMNTPVICEKALAATPAQAEELCRLREETRGFLAVTYNYTGYPMVRELRDMILGKELGKIVSVQAEMPQEGYLRTQANPQAWRREDGSIPGVHLDLGTHLHHLIHFLTDDRPAALVAHHTRISNFNVVDDVQCIAEYQSGFTASLWFGKTALGHRNGLRIRVNGTRQSVEWRQAEPEELHIARADGHRYLMDRASPDSQIASLPRYQRFKAGHPAGFIEAHANLYSDLAEWLHGHLGENTPQDTGLRPILYGPEIAHEGLVMMEAMVKSAKEKSWVTM